MKKAPSNPDTTRSVELKSPRSRIGRAAIILFGIVLGQLVLYGASFAGTKVLLPLEILKEPGIYIPLSPNQSVEHDNPQGGSVTDPIFEDEPARIFRYNELHAGRLPIWNPYQYAGVPSVSFLSPFAIFAAAIRSPHILPWLSLLLALISGTGTYLFARRILQVGFWPATIAAWCYPVTGFFVFWQSTSLAHPVVWLPWLLCAIDAVLRQSGRWALMALAVITMLTLVSGHLDIAALVLISGGLFAIWDFFFSNYNREVPRPPWTRLLAVVAGWALGFALASSELMHAVDYAATGSRIQERGAGHEERPPIGFVSLPQLVMPFIYGSTEPNSFAMLPEKEPNVIETPASAFTGLLATLLIAPLAWVGRRRSQTIFLSILALLGMAWCLDFPVITSLMRLPGLNLLSFNRFVFATSFAIVSMAVIGLEEISQPNRRWHIAHYIPVAIIAIIAVYCLFRAFVPPQLIAETLPESIARGSSLQWVTNAAGVHRVQMWFVRVYLSTAIVSLLALTAWIYLLGSQKLPNRIPVLIGLLAFAELLLFGYGLAAQCDPRLYYPPLQPFENIAHLPPGRVVTYRCLPANLLQVHSLLDARGYDGVDPARYVDLLELAAVPGSEKLNYAAVQSFTPQIADGAEPGTVRLSPVLDLLGVRHVIIPSSDKTHYYLFQNPAALPRVFVPKAVAVESDPGQRLIALGDSHFNPREIAYVEEPVAIESPAEGEASIAEENPQRIVIKTKMLRAGLVVLADQWNAGWRALIDNKQTPILRVDHALRGVIAPAGENTIVFRYQPTSLRAGFVAAILALLILFSQILVRRSAGSPTSGSAD